MNGSISMNFGLLTLHEMKPDTNSSADVLCGQLEAKRRVVDEHRKSITDFYDSLLPLLSLSCFAIW